MPSSIEVQFKTLFIVSFHWAQKAGCVEKEKANIEN